DACSLNDPNTGQPTIPDRDGDGIADFADNCVYIANTDQDDINAGTFLRGIGDACRQEADVTFASPAEFSFDISAPIQNGDITFSLVDFSSLPGDMSAPVKCDTMTPTMCVPNNDQTVPLGMCSLDESLVEARAI
ncbi:MAG: thrombospondin type 3 repeat-containing protein, partial [Acidobacteriota bacterium]|nr:thrombospondin type 3 repeat-containing protein [Acidobacteriota bacterium]